MKRILMLDDDNHGYYYVIEKKAFVVSEFKLLNFLARPHDESYQIKKIYNCDIEDSDLLEKFDKLSLNGYSKEEFEAIWKIADFLT